MYNFSRKKRVTDPFDDEAKARLFGRFEPGSVSSGSEHSGHKFEGDVASPSLSDLLSGVLFDNEAGTVPAESKCNDSGTDTESLDYGSAGSIRELKLILTRYKNTDSFKDILRANVVKSMGMLSCVEENNKSILRRNVTSFLRNVGYNAAICKTKWERSGGLNGGNYEFIDVVRSDISTRYFIDLDFMSGFQLARPTKSYEEILNSLPRLFIGTEDELKQILRIVSDVSRRSLRSCGLHIPPWRKHRFMQQKWFGPYKRTVNLFPASFGNILPCDNNTSNKVVAVKCRAVGFDQTALFPAATRTR